MKKYLLLLLIFFSIFTNSLYAIGVGGYTSITYDNYYPRNVLLGGGIVFDELDDLLNGDFDDEVVITLLLSLLLIITGIIAIFRNYFSKKGYKNDKEFGVLNKFF